MGRHSSGRSGGARSPVIGLSAVLVVALVGWLSYAVLTKTLGSSDCDTVTPVTVAAAPEIAPVLAQVAADIRAAGEECFEVTVANRDPEAVANTLAVSDGSPPPDVWVPDSTLWLRRAQAAGAWRTPVTGTPVASSPVVLAATEEVAEAAGWPKTRPTWRDVLGGAGAVGFPDPTRDSVGTIALFAIATQGGDEKATTSTLRGLSANIEARSLDLFPRLPGTTGSAPPLSAFPTSELAVLRHNVKQTLAKTVAVYPEPALPPLDFPFVVLPTTPDAKRPHADRLLARLLSDPTRTLLGAAGLRAPDGTPLRDRPADDRVTGDRVAPGALPDPDEVDRVLNEWAGVNLSARIQVLLDVSGSMAEQVPGTGRSRMSLTLDAAELGIKLFKPTTKIGLWLFSTKLDGDKDYKELLPVRPVSEHLAGDGIQVVRSAEQRIGGATGLFDSTLAAYRSARQNWEPGRINLVIVLTDGKNEDRDGVSREQLLTELATLVDPKRPIPIIGIGVGPDIDIGELQAISGATGGNAFATPDPSKIADTFYTALSKLLCQPPTCKPDQGE
ncbi:MAG TPA: substrate-binding and VWA domain-containing protein [Actinokineospora sp.]|nr:substrate-binding and VWA domain-containing protein [Actinokineospora sp.]